MQRKLIYEKEKHNLGDAKDVFNEVIAEAMILGSHSFMVEAYYYLAEVFILEYRMTRDPRYLEKAKQHYYCRAVLGSLFDIIWGSLRAFVWYSVY